MPRRRGKRLSARLRRGLVKLGLGIAVVAMLAASPIIWTFVGPGPAAKKGETTTVLVRRGASVREIAETLEKEGVIASSDFFLAAVRLTRATSDIKAGEYAIASRTPLIDVLAQVRSGDVVRHEITVPEGWTSEMAADAVRASAVLTGPLATPPEGALLPDTYHVQRGDTRVQVIDRMREARDQLLADLWMRRQEGLPIRTPEEAVILASIVEKETGVARERPRIAAVFVNRLRSGMRLESDPTIIYGVSKGRALGRGILASEIAEQTAWNTYQIDGLPPTPIANPGRESLAAVLNPPKTKELFFVADGTGGHVFASSYAEHQRNVANWRGVERKKAAEAK
jgi:UPF0755 protein